MKQPLSVGAQMFWGKIFVGCLWIGSGISGMFDNTFCRIIHLVLLAAAIAIMIMLMRVNLEKDDEMSLYNYTQAKAKSSSIMHLVFCIGSVVSAICAGLLKDVDVSWYRVIPEMFFVLMGVHDLAIGLVFRKLEAE